MSREVRRRAGECERDEDSIKSSSQPASVARTGKLRKVDGGRVTKATGSKENKRRACEAQKLGEARRRQHTERQRDAGCRVASSAGCGGSRGCRVVRRVVDPEVSVRHGRRRGGGFAFRWGPLVHSKNPVRRWDGDWKCGSAAGCPAEEQRESFAMKMVVVVVNVS
jgi:hypothetical protein